MKSEVLKAVWPKGIPLEEYPRAVALLETVATAKHWQSRGQEDNRLRLVFPGVHGSPIGVVSPTTFESLMQDVEEAAKKSAGQDYVRPEDFIASPETLRIWKKPRSHCSEALVQRVATLLRAEHCTIARLCALTRKTDRPIAEALRRLGAVEAGRVFRADGSNKGTLPRAWKLPEPWGR